MNHSSLVGKLFLNRYLVGSCIGFGSFGHVYLVYDIEAEQIYAMKSQAQKIKNPQLINEVKIIKELSGQKGFVPFHYFGYEAKNNVVIMGLLGPSLEDLFNVCNRNFTLKTILMLAEQIINRIQVFHSKNYVYRDIKPENFLMGLHQNSHLVHLIDFGLSKKYRDTKNHQHIPYKQNRCFVGTVRYCSINAHLGIEYSRRDDLQSIGYMLEYFYKGNLPWQGIHANTTLEKYAKILEIKQSIAIQNQFMGMPIQFSTYMHYCRSLKFSQRPDYSFLRKLFTDLMDKLGYQRDYQFDWCKLEHSAKLENGTMSLTVRSKYTDLQNPFISTMISGDMNNLKLQNIKLKLNKQNNKQNEPLFQKQKQNQKQSTNSLERSKQKEKQLKIESKISENSHPIIIEEDQQQGNIDPGILEDSELKLISHRSKWYEAQL